MLTINSTPTTQASSTSTTTVPHLITTSNVTITESSHSSSSSDTVMIAAIAGGFGVLALIAIGYYIFYKKTHSTSAVIPDIEFTDNSRAFAHWNPSKYAVGDAMPTHTANEWAGYDTSTQVLPIYSIPTTGDNTLGSWSSYLYAVGSMNNNGHEVGWDPDKYAVQELTSYGTGTNVAMSLYDLAGYSTYQPYGYPISGTYDDSNL